MTTSADYYPDFFIFFLPEQRSQRMIIPNAFHEFTRLKENLPEDVILRDHRSGRVWHVKAHFIGDKLCLEFDDGWKQFRKENNLNKADFLVFSYDGNKEFKFQIFDLSSGCERMKVKEEEVHNGEKDYMMVENIKEENFEYIAIREEDEHEDKDSEMEEEEDDDEEDDGDKDDSDEDYTEMEEENEEEYSGNKRSQCNSGASKANVLCIRGSASTSAPKTEDPELEDYEDVAEMCVHPDNPYFVAKHQKHKLNMLHIPKAIITEFSLSFPEKIRIACCQCKNVRRSELSELLAYHQSLPQQTLICSERREVTGKVCRWKDGRLLVLGWKKFFRKHKIQENDVCICEIVLGEDENIKMLLVHVRCASKL